MVPLDYGDPNGVQLQLAVIRFPATDPGHRVGALLLNPGGPGGSGTQFLNATIGYLSELNTRFDLVSWDPAWGRRAGLHALRDHQATG
jgi:hypothetical protein